MRFMNHVAGRDCLLEMDGILRSLHLPYFLMQGTALGAHRDGGFVPTERDIDLGVLQEHLQPKVRTLMGVLMDRGFDVEAFTMPFTRPRTVVLFKQYAEGVAKVDLVGMIPWTTRSGERLRFTQGPVRAYVEEPYALVHRAETVENYQNSQILWGRRFPLPADIETYLLWEYGPKWQIPKDDHVSRTRVYNFVERERIPRNYLEQWD